MEKLNLTPQERRLVAGVGLIVFVFLNIWLVWPHFGDWRKISDERDKAERTLKRYETEVSNVAKYQSDLHELERIGESVVSEEQDLNLMTVVRGQALVHKLEVYETHEVKTTTTQTNQFFDEKAVNIGFRAGTEELVNFLESLTSTGSLIRVRDMKLSPEPPTAPHRLSAGLTLVASYQRQAPGKPTAAVSNPESVTPPPRTSPPSPLAKTTAASGAKTNALTKPSSSSKPAGGVNVATNRTSVGTGTNKTEIPRRKPLVPSLPKS